MMECKNVKYIYDNDIRIHGINDHIILIYLEYYINKFLVFNKCLSIDYSFETTEGRQKSNLLTLPGIRVPVFGYNRKMVERSKLS